MAYYARVKTEAPGNLKFQHLADLLQINSKWAFGMAVSIWCLCWEFEFIDGRMKRFTAKSLAKKLDWEGDPDKLIDALIEANVLEKDRDGTFIAHDFEEEQEGGIKIMLRNRDRDGKGQKAPSATDKSPGASGDSTVVKEILDKMRASKIPGGHQQKRDHIKAWRARGITGDKIVQVVMSNPGKTIFELEKILIGAGDKTDGPVRDSVKAIHEKFLGTGGGK